MKNLNLLLSLSLLSGAAAHADFVVEMKTRLTPAIRSQLTQITGVSKAESFLDVHSDYFSRLVRLTVDPRREIYVREKLVKNAQVKRVEPITEAQLQSIEVAPNTRSLGNDPLTTYQWGLKNQGQILHRDIDDIHDQPIAGVSGMDIHWSKFISQYESRITRPIKVAVVDSGVALEHPDLKDIMLPGWNYTTQELAGDNKPYDDLGHGTHVAGIIGAVTGNTVGVRGVSPHMRIMPIKVLTVNEDPTSPNRPKLALADRITQGILFALHNGADVINLSLGWPRSMDTTYLRNAVKLAQEAGIVVVAAAGNNSHDQTIFPCSYAGVICVGAYSADGSFAPFSNFGGHVDVTAPGDQILSTFPTKLNPTLFRLKGYDILNGTSQAAPYVSAAMGILKAVYPNETLLKLKARLLQSATADGKTLYGKMALDEALDANSATMLYPELKELDSVLFDSAQGSFQTDLNFTALDATVAQTVQATIADSSVSLDQTSFQVPALAAGASFTIHLSGRTQSMRGSAQGTLKLSVFEGVRAREYTKSFFWIRDLSRENDLKTISFASGIDPAQIGVLSDTRVSPLIQSVESFYTPKDGPQYFYMKKGTPDTELFFFKMAGDQIVKAPSIVLKNSAMLASVMRLDLNYDGTPDLMVTYLSQDTAGKETMHLCYYDQNHAPLFNNPCLNWDADKDLIQVMGSDFVDNLLKSGGYHFLPVTLASGEKIALPMFLANGALPKADRNPDTWTTPGAGLGPHLYRFLTAADDNRKLDVRVVDSFTYNQTMRTELGLSFRDSMNLLDLLVQTEADFKAGKVQALFNAGDEYEKKVFLMNLPDLSRTVLNLPGFHPEGLNLNPVYRIGSQGFESQAGNSFGGFYSATVAVSNHFNFNQSGAELSSFRYDHPFRLDDLLAISSNFDTDEAQMTLYFSKNKMVLSGKNNRDGHLFSDTAPVYRYSFLSGRLFSELYFPLTAQVSGKERPALYIDRSQINSNQISIITVGDEKFESYGLLNFSLPPLCRSMNPVKTAGRTGPFSLTLLCSESGNWVLKQLPIAL